MRLIDADALLAEYDRVHVGEPGNARKLIENAPTVKQELKWISCERELPRVGEDVLISVGGMYTAEGCLREDGDWAQFLWDAIIRKDMVGAWQKLPEPWRGEDHEADRC